MKIRDSLTVGVVPTLHSGARWKGYSKSETITEAGRHTE